MNGPGSWLRNAAVAARLAGDRPDLWLPGALGSLAYLAWLPLVLSVASLPKASDFAFLGARMLSSGAFPWNILLLASLATVVVLVVCLAAGLAEAALLRAAQNGTADRSLTRETEAAFTILLLASLPSVAVAAALISGIAAVAPAEYGAPDIGGPLLLRIIGHLVPLLVALALFALLGQAVGAVALRRAVGPGGASVAAAMGTGLREIVAQPVRRVALSAASLLADLLAIALATALLRVLWAPIRVELATGELVSAPALLLLVGFVAAWLALVLAFGALHVWVSTWWSLELGHAGAEGRSKAQEAKP